MNQLIENVQPKRVKMSRTNGYCMASITGLLVLGAAALPAFAADKSSLVAPSQEDMRLYDIASAPQAKRIEQDLRTLVSFGTRHTLSDTASDKQGIGAARRWIEAEFKRISTECGGCLEVITVGDTVQGKRIANPTEVVNVIAIQRGKTDPKRVVMMSGDIDSRVSDVLDATSVSPGANDNASGVAGALEAARVLSKYQFNGTIVYAALSGEEQGLYGGNILADYAKAQNWQVQAVLNNDMIGNISGINGVINNSSVRVFSEGVRFTETAEEAKQRYFSGGENDSASRNLARKIKSLADQYMTNLEVMLVYRLDRFGRGGHHLPFNQAGLPAVRIMETNENYNRQHQDIRVENGIAYGDVIDGVDFDFTAKLTTLNALSLASMAWAPAPPTKVTIAGQVSPSTTLSWAKSDDKTIVGYRIYWRLTTVPQWTHSRYVGKVDQFTLDNMVIDNYLFGVASVAANGNVSPVVFPGAAGAFFK
ncbi:MAG: M28 family peptidase [Shewanella psychromarinicola]|jgi:Zn-dependent M28 family amino/carboxypeptidase|uniref:M28 family peptidase n=2 Tax=Shewanellaceae TaxID=267890 RepID=A0A3N4EDE4_9GAMM|nr:MULTISPECIES: M28 family peptidase [Shewanella]AZG34177.1 M28 family peptidase [Shewanella psychromarinicola]MCL1081834.1 M28 family peptidase [Shewanella psychromarinicola]PKG79187.1 peptidase M28 [Shewanella sp. Actino-trap-3]RPA32270.1 M28 family peptidase [Shewanella psychromarinicola]|tara:strand:+ start:136780 stop:138216 length:1437 start_codon:yes stop_codon:yes gene_type:complete